jgi:nucleoid-associated protein YgaU
MISQKKSDSEADFSGVTSRVDSSAGQDERADFSGVSSMVDSSADMLGTDSYTIKKGDTLSAIAQDYYGQASAWKLVFEANRDVLDDPDRIHPGQVIKLPRKPGVG